MSGETCHAARRRAHSRRHRRAGSSAVGVGTSGRQSRRRGVAEQGFALVLVLVLGALLGLAALSLAFTVTLDTLAGRNFQEAVLAEGRAEGALALAVRAAGATAGDPPPSAVRFGPWPDQGIAASVDALWDADGTVRFRSRAVVGRSSATRTLVARFPDGGGPVIEARP